MRETNWLPGLVVLGVGAILALVFVLLSRSSKLFAPAGGRDDKDKLLDLEREIQIALDALRDHATEINRLPKEQYEAEKAQLELAAARALKARDDFQKAGGKKAKAEPKAGTAQGSLPFAAKAAIWGGLSVAFFVVLGFVLTGEEKPRQDGMEATGKVPSAQGGGQEAPLSAEEQEEQRQFNAAVEKVRKNGDDVEALSVVAHALLRRQRFEEADALTERGIGLDPFHVETRIHRGMLRGAKGDFAGAAGDLEKLANLYPDSHEALLFAGAMALELGDRKRALSNFQRYMVEAPVAEQPPQIRMEIAALRAELGQ